MSFFKIPDASRPWSWHLDWESSKWADGRWRKFLVTICKHHELTTSAWAKTCCDLSSTDKLNDDTWYVLLNISLVTSSGSHLYGIASCFSCYPFHLQTFCWKAYILIAAPLSWAGLFKAHVHPALSCLGLLSHHDSYPWNRITLQRLLRADKFSARRGCWFLMFQSHWALDMRRGLCLWYPSCQLRMRLRRRGQEI